jgi:putative hydrolase of the HAD superfamily
MKKLVIFDAMGVIYKTSDDVKYLLYPFLKELDGGLTFKRVNSMYMRLSLGEITSKELFSSLGFGSQYPGIEKRYLDSRLVVDEGFVPAAERLSGSYDMAMLSNDAAEWSAYLRRKFGLDKYFTTCIISGDAGIRKPSPGIYELLLEKTGRRAVDCAFIDDIAKNLESARKTGLATIWFDRNGEKDGWDGHKISDFYKLDAVLQEIFT